jgi:hypothetical protein
MTRELSPAEKAVFGADAKIDELGNVIEQGFGSIAKKTEAVIATEKVAEEKAKAELVKLEQRAKDDAAKAEQSAKEAGSAHGVFGKIVEKIEEVF